ncbi:DUF6177 family protein [Nocardiopsis algeriensis]|uniref:DUF6177 family protein n=1 Tax=Nocardiopsis algeriensis TaxID=1478215 RepID=UPI003B437B70
MTATSAAGHPAVGVSGKPGSYPLPVGHTVVALLHEHPTLRGLLDALSRSAPHLRARPTAGGVLVELRDDRDCLVAAVQAAQRLAVLAEAERLLGPVDTGDVPAQPWWVEARSTGIDPSAHTTLTEFASALTSSYGGTVHDLGPAWPPNRQSVPSHPGLTPHPALTLLTERALVAVDDRSLVPLSTMLCDALATHGPAGRPLQLVTRPGATVTPVLASLLAQPLQRWVVAEDGGGYHDGLSGEPLRWDDHHGFTTDTTALGEQGLHPDHVPSEGARAPGWRLTVNLTTLHPATGDLLLGEAVETLARHLAGGEPALFGPGEPLCLSWDTAVLTGLCRDRAPSPSLLAFSGTPASVRPEGVLELSGTLRVQRVREGVKETIAFTVVHPPGSEPDLDTLPAAVAELTAQGILRTMSVHRIPGQAPEPRWTGFPAPVGVALGPEGVAEVGRDHALAAPVEATSLGPRLTPALWYRTGEGTSPEDWKRLTWLTRHLRGSLQRP